MDGDWRMKEEGRGRVAEELRAEGIDVIERRVMVRRSHGRMKVGMECVGWWRRDRPVENG